MLNAVIRPRRTHINLLVCSYDLSPYIDLHKNKPAPKVRRGHDPSLCRLSQRFGRCFDPCRHPGILQQLHHHGCIIAVRCSNCFGLYPLSPIACRFKQRRVLPAVFIRNAGVKIGHHFRLRMPRISPYGLDIATIQLQFISDAHMPQAVKHALRAVLLLNEFNEGSTFHFDRDISSWSISDFLLVYLSNLHQKCFIFFSAAFLFPPTFREEPK